MRILFVKHFVSSRGELGTSFVFKIGQVLRFFFNTEVTREEATQRSLLQYYIFRLAKNYLCNFKQQQSVPSVKSASCSLFEIFLLLRQYTVVSPKTYIIQNPRLKSV